MFDEEHDKFIIEAYFRTGIRNEGEWKYSIQSCREQFLQQYPNFEVTYDTFRRHVTRVVDRFRDSGSVVKGKSTGRRSVLTQEVLDAVQQRLEQNPQKSIRHLASETGLSYGSCRLATIELKRRNQFLNMIKRIHKFSEEN